MAMKWKFKTYGPNLIPVRAPDRERLQGHKAAPGFCISEVVESTGFIEAGMLVVHPDRVLQILEVDGESWRLLHVDQLLGTLSQVEVEEPVPAVPPEPPPARPAPPEPEPAPVTPPAAPPVPVALPVEPLPEPAPTPPPPVSPPPDAAPTPPASPEATPAAAEVTDG